VPAEEGLAGEEKSVGVRNMRNIDFGDSGDYFSRYSSAANEMVSSDLVGYKPGERRKCIRIAEVFGIGKLRNSLDMASSMVRPGRDRLSGIVEVDETYVRGGKPGKRGRGAAGKALVVIMAQQDGNRIGRVRLCRVPDASGRSLENVIQQCVEQGSEIMTDGWSGYNGLGPQEYNHKVIRDLADGGNNLLPSCHRMASLLKRWLLGTHQGAVSHEHLDYYLDEYTFRFNRRTSQYRGKLFYRLLQQAVTIGPSPYKQMIKQSRSLKPQDIVGS